MRKTVISVMKGLADGAVIFSLDAIASVRGDG